jgi:hypothetical protein
MRWLMLGLLGLLAACGNIERPLAYTSVDDPIWQLPPDPEGGGNAFSHPPVAGNGRIRNGL